MPEPVYINKENQEIPALDFKALLDEGIVSVQEMAGDWWTDYNIHDPGVTILEQVCYALTELGYRANFKFEDLLASQYRRNEADNTYDTYYDLPRIMPSTPVTINDMRKLLIDRIDGLRNIWIKPLNTSEPETQLRGVYMAFAEASPDTITTEKQKEVLRQEIRKNISKYSNLSEAFENVVILDPIDVFIKAEVELTHEANVDEVHAHVLFNLSRCMTRPMEFQSLETMMRMGKPINEIFEGPRLQNGFVDDSDLVKKITIVNATTFVTPIKNVPGVSYVRSLTVNADGITQLDTDSGFIDLDKIPRLGNKVDGEQYIKYTKHKSQVEPNLANVEKIFNQLKEAARVQQAYNSFAHYPLPHPQGLRMDIGTYYSFQNQFPVVYGLGEMGLPHLIRGEKKTAVMQLKGYLLIFDQILANYFAQLEHFSDLFSLDKNVTQTYFAGCVDAVKDLRQLLMPREKEEYAVSDRLANQYLQRVAEEALAQIDNFNDRRNRFLDHLLARFGERIADYGLSKFNMYYTKENYEKRQIGVKINLLTTLVKLARNRSRSFDYGADYWGRANISAMEWKIKILLDLPTQSTRLAAHNNELWRYFQKPDHFNFGHIFSRMHAERISPVTSEFMEIEPDPHNYHVDPEVISKIIIDDEMIAGIFKPDSMAVVEIPSFHHHHHRFLLLFAKRVERDNLDPLQQQLLDDVLYLFQGVGKYQRYWIPGTHDNYVIEFEVDPVTKVFDKPAQIAWKEVAAYHTAEEAVTAGKMLLSHVRKLNMDSEGFYLVDHIMLRPRDKNEIYGIHFCDVDNEVSFNSHRQLPLNALQKYTTALAKDLSEPYAYTKTTQTPEGQWRLAIVKDGQEMAYTPTLFNTEDEALEYVLQMSRLTPTYNVVQISPYYGTDKPAVAKNDAERGYAIHHYAHQHDIHAQRPADGRNGGRRRQQAGGYKKYKLSIVKNGEQQGHATQLFDSVEEAQRHADGALLDFFAAFTEFDFFDSNTVQLYKSYNNDDGIKGHDYSSRVTVVLPDWTVRFGNNEFQQTLENLFRMECPAHIAIDFIWVGYTDMVNFEIMYSAWLKALKKEHEEPDVLDGFSRQIMLFVKAKHAEELARLKQETKNSKM